MNVICTVVIATSGIGYAQQSERTSDTFVGPLEPMATRPLALIYYNYRSYNSADGRWINRDPIAEEGGGICTNLRGIHLSSNLIFLDLLLHL